MDVQKRGNPLKSSNGFIFFWVGWLSGLGKSGKGFIDGYWHGYIILRLIKPSCGKCISLDE